MAESPTLANGQTNPNYYPGHPEMSGLVDINTNPNIISAEQVINSVWSDGSPGQGILYTPTPTNTAIAVDKLNSATPLTVPNAKPTADSLDATSAGAQATSKSLDAYIKELTPPDTQTSKDYNSLTSSLESLLPGLTGRGTEQVTAEQNAGLPDLKVKLAGLNAQILAKVAEANKTNASYDQLIANLENPQNQQQQGIPMAAIIGQQAQARKLQLAENNSKSADLMLLQAVASGMQGNITAMQLNIDRAIDLKYSDREAEVDLKMKQLQLLEGKLNKEEQTTKLALERKYQDEQTKIQEEKAKAKDNINLAFSANVQTKYANKGGEWFRVSDGHAFSTPEELFKDAGLNSFDQLYKKGQVTDLNATRVADIEFVQQLRAKYPDAGITINDSATTASQKLAKSRIYQEAVRPPQYVTHPSGTGNVITTTANDNRIKQIISANPGEYGNAANQIDAEFGAGTATKYDDWLRRVYNYGQNINDISSGKTPTQANYESAGFAGRLTESGLQIDKLAGNITKMNYAQYQLQKKVPSNYQSAEFRQYDQAVTNFITAKLRKESGASISPSEFADAYKVYIPQPGDDKTTLANKAKVRQQVTRDQNAQAGNALQIPSSQPSNSNVIPKGTDGTAYGFPGYVSDGTQWVSK